MGLRRRSFDADSTDTSTQCVTVMQQKWLWRWVIVKCWDVVNWVWPGYAPIGHGSATLSGGNVSVVASTVGDGVSFTLPVAVGVKQSFSIEFGALSSAGAGTAVRVQELRAGKWVALASVEPRRGLVEVEFTPTASSVQLVFAGPMTAVVSKACIAKWDLVQDQVLVDICDWDKDRYRFGFNGQEKVNEWAGVGNFMDYKERGQDTRIARFISVDPLTKKFPMLTPYQFASNTPIQAIDLDGLEGMKSVIREWNNSSGEPQINVETTFDLNSPKYGNKGVLIDYMNLSTEETYTSYHVFPEVVIRPPQPSAFDKWWGLQKSAWGNDYEGKVGYEALGKHVVPTIGNSLGLLIGVGELNAAWKAKSVWQASIASIEVGLSIDDLLGGGNDETPLERSLPQNGKVWLNWIKAATGAKGAGEGYRGVKNGLKEGKEVEELGQNLFKAGKSANDTKESSKKAINQSGKLGMGSSAFNTDEKK